MSIKKPASLLEKPIACTATKKSRIIQVSDFSPPYFGGMESHAAEFFRHFAANGRLARSLVMFPSAGASLEGAQSVQPFLGHPRVSQIFSESIHKPEQLMLPVRNYLELGSILFFNSMYWVRCFEGIKKQYPSARILMRSGGNDIMQSNIFGKGGNVFERQRYAVEQINAHSDALIVNSNYSMARFEALGMFPGKMRVVSGGVDTARFNPPGGTQSKDWLRASLGLPMDSPIFFSAVRLVPFKSVSSTIEAFGIFASEFGKKAFLVIAGSGIELEKLQEKAKALPANAVVIFIPPVPPSQIHLHFMASDVYVQTPVYSIENTGSGYYVHTETMGRSFCEAASCGVPSVSFNSGGVSEIILHGKTGFVSGHDTGEFAGYMAASLERRNELSKNAREYALSTMSWGSVFSKYEAIFDGLQ